jgi:hypothetical protein
MAKAAFATPSDPSLSVPRFDVKAGGLAQVRKHADKSATAIAKERPAKTRLQAATTILL